ncbi:MAG TPA: ribosomal protein S18-alanine N-acetyltransferase [Methanoregulaceae archaeon]|nr:MAG: ribosomal protein S18-alanine N-acetyltransferase [Methanolinea sp.]HON82367.1 ribosomal protein S18-alanine N-acetyltransferase [Methanoregulaceae archaeon]HPD11165.1 ribosomal protein S18-alanine N-acetyltransferase [Methanoregulaceae archaeon]HRT16185.1 ribosomal protein S18-alanine N-acetyltransferase [Methanoregulaceae archaeon]HRU31733.1 ribosomal protein S18-alanine N-acetyltransferase [Methanoregulaceae archaeon]
MGAEITIRKARQDDIGAITAIEAESFPDPWSAAVLAETLAYFPSNFFVADHQGRVVGFVAGGIEDTGAQVYGHICNLAVTPSYRKRGVGRMLVRRAERQFAIQLAAGVQLEVRVSNTAAQQFYHRLGYRQIFLVNQYYANGEDAVVMLKEFRF